MVEQISSETEQQFLDLFDELNENDEELDELSSMSESEKSEEEKEQEPDEVKEEKIDLASLESKGNCLICYHLIKSEVKMCTGCDAIYCNTCLLRLYEQDQNSRDKRARRIEDHERL